MGFVAAFHEGFASSHHLPGDTVVHFDAKAPGELLPQVAGSAKVKVATFFVNEQQRTLFCVGNVHGPLDDAVQDFGRVQQSRDRFADAVNSAEFLGPPVQLAVRLHQLPGQLVSLFAQTAFLQCPVNRLQHLLCVEGLDDIVFGSQPESLHRRLLRPMEGHQDYRDVGLGLFQRGQHFQPHHLGHPLIHDDQVGFLVQRPLQPGLTVFGGDVPVTVWLQDVICHKLKTVIPVVNDQYLFFGQCLPS